MRKIKAVLIIGLVLAMVVAFAVLPGCKTTTATETAAATTAAATTAAATTAAATTAAAETTAAAGGKTYDDFRAMAKAGKYEGEPAKGHTIAFANIIKSFPFCTSVENDIIKQWKLAGGADADLTVLDNAADPAIAIQNKDIIFNKKPEVFLQFQLDAKVNDQIAKEAKEKGIFVIAIDVPVGDFPFMGVNNYGTSELTGNWAVEQIDKVYGGWDNVDLVIYPYNPTAGATVQQRIVGSMDVFKAKYGEAADGEKKGTKAILIEAGSTTDDAKAAFGDILAAYPTAENIVVFCLNDQTASGLNAAAEIAGRWDPEKFLVMSQGLDELGMELLRKNVIDGDSAYFPEKYGEYLIPGALAYMYGGAEAVPKEMFVENVIVTPDSIDEYYPQ
jgi:ribose transport system substrate-binding protein